MNSKALCFRCFSASLFFLIFSFISFNFADFLAKRITLSKAFFAFCFRSFITVFVLSLIWAACALSNFRITEALWAVGTPASSICFFCSFSFFCSSSHLSICLTTLARVAAGGKSDFFFSSVSKTLEAFSLAFCRLSFLATASRIFVDLKSSTSAAFSSSRSYLSLPLRIFAISLHTDGVSPRFTLAAHLLMRSPNLPPGSFPLSKYPYLPTSLIGR